MIVVRFMEQAKVIFDLKKIVHVHFNNSSFKLDTLLFNFVNIISVLSPENIFGTLYLGAI